MSVYDRNLSDYAQNIREQHLDRFGVHKHLLCTAVALKGEYDEAIGQVFLDAVRFKKLNSDFQLIRVIRLLHLDATPAKVKEDIMAALSEYPFWHGARHCHTDSSNDNSSSHSSSDGDGDGGGGGDNVSDRKDMDGIVFWSENHILMILGSAHLYRQRCLASQNITCHIPDKINRLLALYLEIHASPTFGEGMYEAISHTYLSWSLCGLLNIVDFSHNAALVKHAGIIIDRIVRQLLLVTTSQDVTTLSASARYFPRYWQKAWTQNVVILTYMTRAQSIGDYAQINFMTDFLVTSTWRPSLEALAARTMTGFVQVKMNPDTHAIRSMYGDLLSKYALGPLDIVPFYWSAGLVTHPDFIADTKEYHTTHDMKRNVHLGSLKWLPRQLAGGVAGHMGRISKGQNYSGVTLNVWKQGACCLSSFEKYNAGLCGFQQNPWMCNLEGVALWTASGRSKKGVAGFGMTHSFMPCISQNENIMAALFAHKNSFTWLQRSLLGTSTTLYFPPAQLFDQLLVVPPMRGQTTETGSAPFLIRHEWDSVSETVRGAPGSWWVGRRGNSFAAVMCTEPTSLLYTASDTWSFDVIPDTFWVPPPASVGSQETEAGAHTQTKAQAQAQTQVEGMRGGVGDWFGWLNLAGGSNEGKGEEHGGDNNEVLEEASEEHGDDEQHHAIVDEVEEHTVRGSNAKGLEMYYQRRVCKSSKPHLWVCVVNSVERGIADMDTFIRTLERIDVDVTEDPEPTSFFSARPERACARVFNSPMTLPHVSKKIIDISIDL